MTPYLTERGLYPPLIDAKPSPLLGIVVVIPCHDEDFLLLSLMSLRRCDRPMCDVEVIVVVNESEDATTAVREKNRVTAEQAKRWALANNLGWLREGATARDRLTWGIGSETTLNENNLLIAETFGQSQAKPAFQLGLRHWLVPNRMQIDATYGNRFGHGTGERWFSLGLRILSAPFL